MKIFFSIVLLAAGGGRSGTVFADYDETNAEASHSTTYSQRRNVLIRGADGQGGGDAAVFGSSKTTASRKMLDDLPDEDSFDLRRQLTPTFKTVGTGSCVRTSPDPYGCDSPKNAICYFHDETDPSKLDDYHTKCWDFDKDGTPVIGSNLPGYSNKFFAACGPCDCFPELVGTGLELKRSKGTSDLQCPLGGPSSMPSREPSQEPSTTPTDTCIACDGEPTFLFNGALMPFDSHNAFAQAMGCQLASINSYNEQAAAEAVLATVPNILVPPYAGVFIGLKVNSFDAGTQRFELEWTDGSGTFSSNRSPNDNSAAQNFNSLGGVYTKWDQYDPNGNGQPISEPFVSLKLDSNGSRYKWQDTADGNYPALYKCCKKPAVGFDGCAVRAPEVVAAAKKM